MGEGEIEKHTELSRSVAAGAEQEIYWVPTVECSVELGLTKQLGKLGQLSDVTEVIDEMVPLLDSYVVSINESSIDDFNRLKV